MPKRVLAFGSAHPVTGTHPHRRRRNRVTTPPQPESATSSLTPSEDEVAADPPPADELDEQIISLLIRRAHRTRHHQLARQKAGLPARQLSRETAMMKQYVSHLGQHGADIAHTMLMLSQSNTLAMCIDPAE